MVTWHLANTEVLYVPRNPLFYSLCSSLYPFLRLKLSCLVGGIVGDPAVRQSSSRSSMSTGMRRVYQDSFIIRSLTVRYLSYIYVKLHMHCIAIFKLFYSYVNM